MSIVHVAAKGLRQRKTMTALALIGLILGVGTIVTLVSVSTGIQNLVSEKTGELKGIMVLEKDSSFGIFYSLIDTSDLKKIEGIAGIRNVCPRVTHLAKSIDGEFMREGAGISGIVMGVDPSGESKKRVGPLPASGSILEGRFLLPSDKKSVVMGKKIAGDYNKAVGSSLKIDGEKFKVVGIYETGSSQTDSYMIVPIDSARKLEGLDKGKVRGAFVELDNPHQLNGMADVIEARVSSVQAISTEEFGQMLGGLLANVEMFLWAISAIAALVAGVNIVNTMLMSIMERERELGIMRAIGWTGDDIIRLIMVESIIIGLIGGVLGVAAGEIAVWAIKQLLDIPMLIDAGLIIESMAFAIAVGSISGLYPAWRASRLNPLEAIKGE